MAMSFSTYFRLPSAAIFSLLIFSFTSPLPAAETPDQHYLGEQVCAGCHPKQSSQWQDSHHDMAMQPANSKTVLGDFNKARFSHDDVTSVFFKRGEAFLVNTQGDDGKLRDFEIKYTFGVYPLQQYLVEFSGGRLQALNIAWDSRPAEQGGQRWFRLNPDEHIPAGDVLHWTGPNLNWNYMCAECHSTNLEKNYNQQDDSYNTTWSEINVSCEACHGPGKKHVDWAGNRDPAIKNKGLQTQFNERQGVNWNIHQDSGLPVRSVPRSSSREIDSCAVCHSRRSQISENGQPGESFNDAFQPSLLVDGLYHADGQINDEVYVYGSFLQSKMNSAGVTCSDCHDPHTASLRLPGEQVCYQCHQAETYASKDHHHHPQDSAGASCIECHMPAKLYMEVDARHDHSFRIPRPDLSVKLNTPNACNNCHQDKSSLWAAEKITSWYGKQPIGHQKFATALHAARMQLPAADRMLAALAADDGQPAIARATAISLLGQYQRPEVLSYLQQALASSDSMLRLAALEALSNFGARERVQLVFPLLSDDERSVRMQAARLLAAVPAGNLPAQQKEQLDNAISEYIDAQLFNAERPEAQVNLGSLYSDMGRIDEAEKAYRKAIALQKQFMPAYVNLAQLLSQQKDDASAINVLQLGLQEVGENASLYHALGLALVRQKKMPEALGKLSRAVELDPGIARYSYVYAIALQSLGQIEKAIEILESSYGQHPGNVDILLALVTINRDAGNREQALRYLQPLKKLLPGNRSITLLEQQLKTEKSQ